MQTAVLEQQQFGMPSVIPPIISPKYCLYARKSSEDDERQALSIDSQINEMMEMAKRENLEVVDVRRESHSAKASSCRPVFNQLLIDIKQQKFSGIITWAPDRLSRNAGDLGTLVDLMDQGFLADIRTHSQRFTNSPNEKFLLMILCSQAKLENDNRGINIKRGLKTRAQLGHRPCLSPLGYLNEKTFDRKGTIVTIDPVRGPIVKKMFEKVAYEKMSGRKLYAWFNDIGFTTRNGKKTTLSGIYRMLNEHFYYGMFEFPQGSGKWCTGNYEPLITKELFDLVHEQLKVPPRPEYGLKQFDFTRLIKCGTCNYGVTAQEKIKKYKSGKQQRYVYYRCSSSYKNECQEPFINEIDLTKQLVELMDKVSIDQIGAREKLEQEVKRYKKFSQGVLGMTGGGEPYDTAEVDIRNYAKYLLKEGSREEKWEVLSLLESKLLLKNKQVYV